MSSTEDNTKVDSTIVQDNNAGESTANPHRPHKKGRWLRRILRVFAVLIILLCLIPVAVYVPPVQNALKNLACKIVKDSSGLDITIERFRLKFPLDVSLEGVAVVEASGDTMMSAQSAVADVRMLPLFSLDIKLNALSLNQAQYNMTSPDSSMVMKIRAALLEISPGSSFNLGQSRLNIEDAKMKDADVSLYMNVWKQKKDTASSSTPFHIECHNLEAQNLRFAMSMLPTIDTLVFDTHTLHLREGVIDLEKSKIALRSVIADDGEATYLTPTAEYIASHPLPMDTVATAAVTDTTGNAPAAAPPFVITADSISLLNFNALYAISGAEPLPGFDPSYIQASGIDISLNNFYNEASTIKLPITMMKARERSGLEILDGTGTVSLIDETLYLDSLKVSTPWSKLQANLSMPLDVMTGGSRPMIVNASGQIGVRDVKSFMPDLGTYISAIPSATPIELQVEARGTLASIDVQSLDVNISRVLKLKGEGRVDNPMDFNKMAAAINLEGALYNPAIAQDFIPNTGVDIPAFEIEGDATVRNRAFTADLGLYTDMGDMAAKGRLNINSEQYFIDAEINDFEVAKIIPDLGIGNVSAQIYADGVGFNPEKSGAHTDARIEISRIDYRGHNLHDIAMAASLRNSDFLVNINSPNTLADMTVNARGTIKPDDYSFNVSGDIRNLDLYALGLTDTVCGGLAKFNIRGNARPGRWLYNVNADMDALYWELPGDMIVDIPGGLRAKFLALENNVSAVINCRLTELSLESAMGLEGIMGKLATFTETLPRQIEARYVDIDSLQKALPPFHVELNASGRGMLKDIMAPMGINVDTLYAMLDNSDILSGRMGVLKLNNSTVTIDTVELALQQRGKLLDYHGHMGNRPGTLDEFKTVNVNGYVGTNRFSLAVNQQNLRGETGYRLGLTGALQDSMISVHFTPLKSTIAYMPWTFNADNHIDLGPGRRIDADLQASSAESSIMLQTKDNADGNIDLHAALENIKIEDFLKIYVFAPPMTGSINSDINLIYKGDKITGSGTLGLKQFTYERRNVGDFNLAFDMDLDFKGDTHAEASLMVNGRKAITAYGLVHQSPEGMVPDNLGVALHEFPIDIVNAFLDKKMAQAEGKLNGDMKMTGTLTRPVLNGFLACDSVSVLIPMMGSSLRLGNEQLDVTDNVVKFDNFEIFGQNANPISINGDIDARKLTDILIDMSLAGRNFQLVNNDRRARSDIYGKAFLDIDASARGSLSRLNVNANLTVLNATDVSYTIPMMASSLQTVTNADDVVKFIQFSDTIQSQKADSLQSMLAMRINAGLTIDNGAQITVNLSGNGTDKVTLAPSGTLNYYQNYMGDMTLNGQLNLGTGYAQYTIPVIGRSVKFNFNQDSYVLFNGDIMNPTLNINATDNMKVSVTRQQGGATPVNFNVDLTVTGTLSNPGVLFDLSTNDDVTIQNQLQSMSADQRSNQAINLLLYGQYLGQGYTTAAFNGESMLYGFLTSQLNSWAANNIRGVDLSFGVDQYDTGGAGSTTTATSYSYQVSKSLFNNKFKIIVGGNYSTDASADENFSQNLINDIAFEYMLKQTNNLSIYLQLFRHTGYESILEGEITETGAGFVMRRRLNNLRELFRFRAPKEMSVPTDTLHMQSTPVATGRDSLSVTPKDSVNHEE